MRVLHVGLMVNESRNIGLSKAFKDNSEHYEEIEINNNTINRVGRVNFRPHIVFTQIQNDKIGGQSVNAINVHLNRLRSEGAFIINWTGDKRANTPSWMSSFNADLTCFSNWEDVHRFRGKSDFLQIGIDPEVFHDKHNKFDIFKNHDWISRGFKLRS